MIDKFRKWGPGLALLGFIVAGIRLALTPAATAMVVLPYAGLEVGALVFVPQLTFHIALWMLGFVFVSFAFIVSDRFFGAILPLSTRTLALLLVGAGVVVGLLFALARFDYWALYSGKLVVQRPWGQTVYNLDDVRSVSVGCRLERRSRGQNVDVIYALMVNGRNFDIARDSSMVLGTGLEHSVRVIEGLQPRLIAQGVTYRRLVTYEDCVAERALELGGDGLGRLWNIGVRAR
jgi:hypothetical protein